MVHKSRSVSVAIGINTGVESYIPMVYVNNLHYL